MSDFIKRLEVEHAELSIKISKLGDFMRSDNYENLDAPNAILLDVQIKQMRDLNNTLIIRLALLN